MVIYGDYFYQKQLAFSAFRSSIQSEVFQWPYFYSSISKLLLICSLNSLLWAFESSHAFVSLASIRIFSCWRWSMNHTHVIWKMLWVFLDFSLTPSLKYIKWKLWRMCLGFLWILRSGHGFFWFFLTVCNAFPILFFFLSIFHRFYNVSIYTIKTNFCGHFVSFHRCKRKSNVCTILTCRL